MATSSALRARARRTFAGVLPGGGRTNGARRPGGALPAAWWGAALPAASWAALVLAGALLGRALYAADPLVRIGNAPLVGSAQLEVTARLLPALALALAAVAWGPALARRLPWRRLLLAGWAVAAAWAVALAFGGGLDALAAPLETRYEYLAAVDRVGSPGAFLAGYVDALAGYPTHVKGHPPGMVLLLWALDRVGLGGAAVAAAVVIGAGALAVPAALVALRALAAEGAARRAAPFLALAPAALWIATSADALFAGVAAVGIALFAVAASRGKGGAAAGGGEASAAGGAAARGGEAGALALALAAGVVLGLALHLSYGIAPLGAVVVAIAVWRRALGPLLAAGAGVLAVALASGLAGFWWWEGLDATRALYESGVATRRPYADFLVINLAAFALAVGPAAAAGLARLRGAGAWVLAGGALVAIAAADLSGLSRGETERIWLPFAPWVLVATAALGAPRRWLAAQVALALVLQATVDSPW